MMQKTTFRAMGCQMMAALDKSSHQVQNRLDKVAGWFEIWEQTLSRFRADSELSQVNQSDGSIQVVNPIFWEVFLLSLEIARRSSGLVSPLILDALLEAGYSQSFELLTPSSSAISLNSGAPIPELDVISWDAKSHAIQLPPELRLDFGGVAKGWAAHKAMNKLKVYGPALVDAGGDIAISGLREGGLPWPVAIADPHHPGEELALLKVGRGGVATSGTDYRRWKAGGRWRHHIIDPRTGLPAETDLISVTAIAPTVVDAEMAAKVILILGSQQGLDWLENQPGMAALIVLADGNIFESNHFNKYLWE